MQEFSHDCYHSLQRGFAASQQTLVKALQIKLMAYGDQRRQAQSSPQVTTTTSADPRFLLDGGAGTEPLRIESTKCNSLACVQCVGEHG